MAQASVFSTLHLMHNQRPSNGLRGFPERQEVLGTLGKQDENRSKVVFLQQSGVPRDLARELHFFFR